MYYHPLRVIHSLTDEVHAFITAADSCCQICGCFLLRLLRRLNRLQRKAPSVTMYPCVLNKPSVCCSATEREREMCTNNSLLCLSSMMSKWRKWSEPRLASGSLHRQTGSFRHLTLAWSHILHFLRWCYGYEEPELR